MNKRILVVAAHPDDEVLGCGGTIAKHTRQGDEVYLLILGTGVASRYGNPAKATEEEFYQLKLQARKSSEILGVSEIFFKDFPDNRFDSVPLLDIVKAVEDVKAGVRPNVIYTHHHGDLNIDHQITFKAVLTACRPLRGETVKEIYSFEVPSSTEWNMAHLQNCFLPNVFVDIRQTLEKKIEALQAYKSEIREYPHPRSPDALRVIAKRWGCMVECEAAEVFQLIRSIRRC